MSQPKRQSVERMEINQERKRRKENTQSSRALRNPQVASTKRQEKFDWPKTETGRKLHHILKGGLSKKGRPPFVGNHHLPVESIS